jgi:hypothetical protein
MLTKFHCHIKRSLQKFKNTCDRKYGVDNPARYKQFREKQKQTTIKKYGHEHALQNEQIKEKRKQTNLEKYGYECPLQNKEVRQKIRQTCLEKYSCEYSVQNEQVKEKIKQANLKKYGHEYSLQNQEVRQKIKQTCLKKYECEYSCQDPSIALKIARSHRASIILKHWKTGQDIVCVASYEPKVVQYFNDNKIDFVWQVRFDMPNGKKYFVDVYLPEQKIYVEIKGYFYKDAKEKWDWFHKEYPNSELWDKQKLKELKIL